MKGYPKSVFDVVNQTQIQSIETTQPSGSTRALYMQPYTSNKGTEDWELITGFDGFTKNKGGMSFKKHGQAQLAVAQALRTGAYVLGKRMVSEDATLANVTVLARCVKVESVTYLYIYTKSAVNCKSFDSACEEGYGSFDPEAEEVTDIPLFTVTPMGRGESVAFFKLMPEYTTSRNRASADFVRYSFEIEEDSTNIESTIVTINPEIIIDSICQGINPKIKTNSSQVRVKAYEDGIYRLVAELAKTAIDGEENPIVEADLINMDFINGYNIRGTEAIGGIVTINNCNESNESEWTSNKPAEIEVPYDLTSAVGVPLVNGSYGKLGNSPMDHPDEIKKLLLGVFGNDVDSAQFDTLIYDLDAYKVDVIFDCNWDVEVKNAVVDLVDFRQDCVFLADLGTKANTLETIIEAAKGIHNSGFVAIYHNYFKILDPFTRKEITVTTPYMLIDKMTEHISLGVGRAFAGIANGLYFSNIVTGTINFFPVEIPGMNQKQELADNNINYMNLYDGTPVLETLYVNDPNYSQLSYLHNIMAVQEIIKVVRTRCPRTRYTFLDGDDLETYISDVQAVINQYSTFFKSISCQYMADEKYEQNNIFYAVIRVQFKNFIQEEYFKIIAIS